MLLFLGTDVFYFIFNLRGKSITLGLGKKDFENRSFTVKAKPNYYISSKKMVTFSFQEKISNSTLA